MNGPAGERALELPAGTRVQIRYTLLDAHERAAGVPEDTARLPYQIRVRGILAEPGALGSVGTVRTVTGRLVTGEIELVDPADTHTFGRPVPALVIATRAISRLAAPLR